MWRVAIVASLVARIASADVPAEKLTLSNGLEVILSEDDRLPIARVEVYYRTGAKDEPAGQRGYTLLFVHLRFACEGPGGHWWKTVEELGGYSIGGDNNHERVRFGETVLASSLEPMLRLEARRM